MESKLEAVMALAALLQVLSSLTFGNYMLHNLCQLIGSSFGLWWCRLGDREDIQPVKSSSNTSYCDILLVCCVRVRHMWVTACWLVKVCWIWLLLWQTPEVLSMLWVPLFVYLPSHIYDVVAHKYSLVVCLVYGIRKSCQCAVIGIRLWRSDVTYMCFMFVVQSQIMCSMLTLVSFNQPIFADLLHVCTRSPKSKFLGVVEAKLSVLNAVPVHNWCHEITDHHNICDCIIKSCVHTAHLCLEMCSRSTCLLCFKEREMCRSHSAGNSDIEAIVPITEWQH